MICLRSRDPDGVIVAQGGREHGYAVHLFDGKLAFDVRVRGKVTRIAGQQAVPREFDFEAALTRDSLRLQLDSVRIAEGAVPRIDPGATEGRDVDRP